MTKHLFVANQTLGGPALEDVVRSKVQRDSGALVNPGTEFHVVVPATAPADQQVPVEGDADSIAQLRLQEAVKRVSSIGGVRVTGEVGAADPMQAISDAFASQQYLDVVISTLPRGLSKWLRSDLPRRVERKFDVNVTTIESTDDFGTASSSPQRGS